MSALLFMSAPIVASAHGTLSEIATIIMHLNHYPTTDDKKILAEIAADPQSTAGDKIISEALMRMQHQVKGSDADSLAVRNQDSGELLAATRLYWFVWSTFHPETVYPEIESTTKLPISG
ncbi:MAG: hypothetical protein Q9M17_04490 [Mariprofundus sp.]|nr:hypothetical protein [Mariprofundus sp.]